jgi:hypothetical protein
MNHTLTFILTEKNLMELGCVYVVKLENSISHK